MKSTIALYMLAAAYAQAAPCDDGTVTKQPGNANGTTPVPPPATAGGVGKMPWMEEPAEKTQALCGHPYLLINQERSISEGCLGTEKYCNTFDSAPNDGRFKSGKDCIDAHESNKSEGGKPDEKKPDEQNPGEKNPGEKKPFLQGTHFDCYFIVPPEESCVGTQAWCKKDEWRELDGYSTAEDCLAAHEPEDSSAPPTTLTGNPPAANEQDTTETSDIATKDTTPEAPEAHSGKKPFYLRADKHDSCFQGWLVDETVCGSYAFCHDEMYKKTPEHYVSPEECFKARESSGNAIEAPVRASN